ncbi:MAG: hypothetical protein A2017_14235 [Lentisphaerae bacterium GWF2_44_16]|nr:MAG: hypothetical protein A2017_14235 [Lentisphaerae bacterium GWF2_44_16]
MNWAEKTLSEMSLEERTGQLIWGRGGVFFPKEEEEMLKKGLLGGLSVGRFNKGVSDRKSAIEIIDKYRRLSKYPLLISGNSEKGAVNSVPVGNTKFPCFMALGATKNEEFAKEEAKAISLEMLSMGFCHITMCVELAADLSCHIIATRAFGDNSDLVLPMASAFMKSAWENGATVEALHFLGHGACNADSHCQAIRFPGSFDELQKHISVFRNLIEKGLDLLETVHVCLPQLGEKEDIPITLSKKLTTGFLRETLGFKGIIISDSMTMKAVKDRWGVEEAAVKCVNSGHDFVLQDYETPPMRTFEAIIKAVRDGVISEERINESALRILKFKEKYKVHLKNREYCEKISAAIDFKSHSQLARKIAQSAVTLLKAEKSPAVRKGLKLVIISRQSMMKKFNDLATAESDVLEQLITDEFKRRSQCEFIITDTMPDSENVKRASNILSKAEECVILFENRGIAYHEGTGELSREFISMIENLKSERKPLSIINMGNPIYSGLLNHLADNSLLTYCDHEETVRAAIEILFAEREAKGTLPVKLSPEMPFGFGLKKF